ncbi:MAG: ABC transporter substrate-binding protein [Spirochaetes bacterium]|nr:ABC transporter substrate-binding protein [Spirochaetota bacterium]
MKKKIFLCVIFIVSALLFLSCSNKKDFKTDKIRLGVFKGETSALIFIAEDKGYFKQSGLDAELILYDSGAKATKEMLEGKSDVATAAEFVIVSHSFTNPQLKILCSINKVKANEIIADSRRDIKSIADLKDKRIGLKFTSQAHYVLWEFFLLHGIDYDYSKLVDTNPEEMTTELDRNNIDAVVVWDPYTIEISDHLGENSLKWQVEDGSEFLFLLSTTMENASTNKTAINKLIAGLKNARDFVKLNPEEAKAILSKRLGISGQYLNSVWGKQNFDVRLDQSMLPVMEKEASWMIRNDMTSEKTIPDFLRMIYFEPMISVLPENISIIRIDK